MRRAAAVAVAASVWAAASGCKGRGSEARPLSVRELADLLHSETPPTVYDANGASTRLEYGVIPGAVLLSSGRSYPLDLLPAKKDSSIVFYCASTWCGAAEGAAGRALEAGYTSVSVLPEGIKGWVRAGLPVSRPD